MIDLHCHILPGIDDGAQSDKESLAMARLAVQEGITTIIATPHHKNGRYFNSKQDVLVKVAELNKLLTEEKIALKILPGQESAINGEMIEDFNNGQIMTLNDTNYVFVELPSDHVPRYTEKMLFDLQLKGLIPIIVHPERNREIHERPEMLYKLVEKGALAQLTAGSICGRFGKKIKSFSEQLIEANLVHFIASDAHNVTSRAFHLGQANDLVEKQYGVDMVYLFTENAELVVEGLNVYKEQPQRVKRKKFLGIF
ncbi:tyrosine-protein phosphatase [Mesobacillus maritimus]|uniref:Tyrosine-protein phosphatase n=1 Tax=Mesobacillus maritimus TaxID=1643336 RepID=A0ABS7K4Z3_9BACI|nr:CpsB/CapC family capsule biosynthesis tyrosine phosphatase [Mesobacillus maritimus]MBY0097331.1 tyrosine protein phosphatase [Mesobacillus maritimus]